MSRARLLEELRALEMLREWDPDKRTLAAELAVHQEELRSQNEALLEAQRLLEESRDRFVELFEGAPVPYIALDRQGVVTDVNLAALEFFALPRSAVLGIPLFLRVDPADRQRFWDHLHACGHGPKRETVSTELTLVGVDPRPVFLRSAHSPEKTSFLTTFVDLSERKDAEREAERERERVLSEQIRREEAEKANRLKDDFLATLSHELRNPLSTISGWVYVLLAGEAVESRRHGLEVIRRSVEYQARLVQDLLDVSRITRGDLALERKRVDLAAIVRSAIDATRPEAQAKGIAIEVAADHPAYFVLGDAGRLEQVLANLLGNALKFTDAGGRVDVTLERNVLYRAEGLEEVWIGQDPRAVEHARLRIKDTGQGIPPAELRRIFERFHRVGSASTRSQSGSGLGLAIVRHLVEAHGGSVWAESDGEGTGATFTVQLPIHRGGDSVPEAETPVATAEPALVGVSVLVADDDPDARELAVRLLEPAGAEVLTAPNAAEALRILVENRPRVLVSDVAMPGEDGYSLIRKVRRLGREEGGRTPAVAVTAFGGAFDRERALAAGFDRWLPKPVKPRELIATILDLCRARA